MGHVRVFGSAKYSSSQRQNIFVRVFRWTWISRPTTASQSAPLIEQLLRLAQRAFDVTVDVDHPEPALEGTVHLDQPQLALAGLQRQLHVVDEHRPGAVEHARPHAEHALARRHEFGGRVRERLHRSRSGTVSKPSACSSAWPARKIVFSESWRPISCSPTGRPALNPQGMLIPGSPAMFDGNVRQSARYIASGSAFAPNSNATVGDVGETSRSKRSKSSACSRMMIVRTRCACP